MNETMTHIVVGVTYSIITREVIQRDVVAIGKCEANDVHKHTQVYTLIHNVCIDV